LPKIVNRESRFGLPFAYCPLPFFSIQSAYLSDTSHERDRLLGLWTVDHPVDRSPWSVD